MLWYESRAAGAGSKFYSAVEATILRLLQHPESGRPLLEPYRYASVKRYPYGLVYRIEHDVLLIHLVWQAQQDPSKLLRFLGGPDDE